MSASNIRKCFQTSRLVFALQIIVLIQQATLPEARKIDFDTNYDPEHQDGIPIISATGSGTPSPFDWTLEGAAKDHFRRRNSMNDEDDDDEDDRDEQKSSSNNHDSYENPAFGESRSSARDGDDIEQFFDKHLGPQDAHETPTSKEEQEIPITAPTGVNDDHDYDDHYAAASSPLVSIFQSILNSHKRPFIIHTTDEESSGEQMTATSGQQQVASNPTPVSSHPYRTAMVQGPGGAGYPVAYVTTPSDSQPTPISSYEQQSSQISGTSYSKPSSEDEYGQVREIYFPSILGHLKGAMSQYPTTAQAGGSQPMVETPVVAASGRVPQDYQQDYSRYPMSASYSSYQQPSAESQSTDEGPVSYGISFGGQPDSVEDPSESGSGNDHGSPDDQSNVEDASQQGSRMHYNRNYMMQHPSSTTQMFQNQHPSGMMPSGYTYRGHPKALQSTYNGPRYFKDTSEYQAYQQQFSGPSTSNSDLRQPSRQQLLAELDRQIKNTPQYRQSVAASTMDHSRKGMMSRPSRIMVRQRLPESDLETYSSYHSEVDPYKSVTASSRIVDDPNQQTSSVSEQDGKRHSKGGPGSLGKNILVGSLTRIPHNLEHQSQLESEDILRNDRNPSQGNLRVRREDSDEREADDADDDGVWVDDDEDDDNRQQSSDVNEISQEPTEQADDTPQSGLENSMSGIVSKPHGYELVPDDLMVYHG